MGAMTWPINVAEELRDAQLLDELKKAIDYTSLIAAQLAYKASILRSGALRGMFQLMTPSLSKTQRCAAIRTKHRRLAIAHTVF